MINQHDIDFVVDGVIRRFETEDINKLSNEDLIKIMKISIYESIKKWDSSIANGYR